jgi:putative ABC transport system permease protein
MLSNYLKTALRSLYKNKAFSLINILGLSIGLASFMLISLYVYHEWSMDRYHKKASRIYRIVENLRTENELLFQSTSSPPMGPMLAHDFPEVQNYVRFLGDNVLARNGNIVFYEENCYLADSTIFDIFSFNLIRGNPKTALREPHTAVLTEKIARKYFGDSDALGKTLDMDGEPYTVTGIMAEVPENSHFQFDILKSFSTWSVNNKSGEMHGWFWNGFHTYILLKDEHQIQGLRAKMHDFIERNVEKGGMHYEDLPLQPLTSIYLETPRSWENGKRGSLSNLYILSIIALFILMIAGFNYVNLSTARASRRLKEVGLRKVLGAQRRMLIAQFLGESIIMSVMATILGFAVAWFVLPPFNSLVETTLGFSILPSKWFVGIFLAVLALVLGLLSGAYPALMISGFEPLQIFRPSLRSAFSHQNFRKILVSGQFIISITLVAGTLLVFDQLSMVRNKDLGFRKKAMLTVAFSGNRDVRDHLEQIRNELLKVPGIDAVTASHTVPGQQTTNLYSEVEIKDGKMSPTNINSNMVDHDFIPAYGIELVAGRNFSRDTRADDTTAFIVNEAVVRDLGWTLPDAIGKRINQGGRDGFVIGVMKDYHYQSLHHNVDPLLVSIRPGSFNMISMKINSENIPGVVANAGKTWNNLVPGVPFRYSFLDKDYDKLYKADMQLGEVAGVFSGLAILVGCLGLLGLTSFSVERRTKEIGIRKVLGASAGQVILLISREFLGLIIVSFVVSIPVTYYLITKWLENFTDRIVIGPVTFALAGVSVLAVAWLTISFLSFRAAATNPSTTLRTE